MPETSSPQTRRATPAQFRPAAPGQQHAMYQTARLLYVGGAEAKNLLQQALSGYEICFASRGYEALRSIAQQSFDLYILDYWLPDWSGTGLSRDIRKSDPYVPIIFCVSANSEVPEARATRAGATAVLPMPLETGTVNAEVAAQMQVSTFRNESGRARAAAAVTKELTRRTTQLRTNPPGHSVARTLERVCHTTGLQAFTAAGGTLAEFNRIWPELRKSTVCASEFYADVEHR